MKRIFLFLATNMAIVLVLSITMRILGVEPYLTAQGLNLTSLLIFAAVMGFGGSLISLAISKWMAKKSMGVQVIETPSNSTEFWLVETVKKYAADAGIGMPEVGIFDFARRQRLRHRHEQEQRAGRGVGRPVEHHDTAGGRSGASATRSPTSPTATW